MMDDKEFFILNKSVEAPISGVYRYVLIPAKNPFDYYIDLFYIFGQGSDEKALEQIEDSLYLKKGEYLIIDLKGNVKIQQKERHLKLVVNNE